MLLDRQDFVRIVSGLLSMTDFQPAWAVVKRDFGRIDGDYADVHDVLRVFWAEEDALKEVERLQQTDGADDRLFW